MIFSGSPSLSGWDNVVYSVETGKTGFEKAQGLAFFDYLAQHPEDASLFSEMMVGLNDQEPPAVTAAYDFSIFQTIMDVGGATGNTVPCWRPYLPVTRGRAASCSTGRMS